MPCYSISNSNSYASRWVPHLQRVFIWFIVLKDSWTVSHYSEEEFVNPFSWVYKLHMHITAYRSETWTMHIFIMICFCFTDTRTTITEHRVTGSFHKHLIHGLMLQFSWSTGLHKRSHISMSVILVLSQHTGNCYRIPPVWICWSIYILTQTL